MELIRPRQGVSSTPPRVDPQLLVLLMELGAWPPGGRTPPRLQTNSTQTAATGREVGILVGGFSSCWRTGASRIDERKHQNVSAVPDQIGVPLGWIQFYKPLGG